MEHNLIMDKAAELDFTNFLFDCIPDAAFILSVDFTGCYRSIIRANKKSLVLSGYSQEELTVLPPERLIRGQDTMPADTPHPIKTTFTAKNNNKIPVELWIHTYMKNHTGFTVWIIKDNSRNEELEKRLIRTRKMEALGSLASVIVHDVNNFLFPIMGHGEMLKLEACDNASVKDSACEIIKGALRAGDLLKQILDFGKRPHGNVNGLKIQDILCDIVPFYKSVLPPSIKIIYDIDMDCPPVSADPSQLYRIFINLITNAYHALEKKGGVVKISVNEELLHQGNTMGLEQGSYALISVADTGEGMDEAVIKHIFEPYFSTKNEDLGTGLGLSAVFTLLKELKGKVKVKSKKGYGTVFNVYIPAESGESIMDQPAVLKKLYTDFDEFLLTDDFIAGFNSSNMSSHGSSASRRPDVRIH